MTYTLINRADLPQDAGTFEFVGSQHPGTDISFIWVDMPPGGAVRLHQHPYQEIFVIQSGSAAYTVGADTLQAHAGQILIVPANTPHKFVNTGSAPLQQVDIHLSPSFITDWLEA
jgi:mannose-6-phosphate isomerase-like protein (cupin superfamily)